MKNQNPLLIHNITVRILKIPRASNPIDARSFRPNSPVPKFGIYLQRGHDGRFYNANGVRNVFLLKYGQQYMNVVRPDVERGNDPISLGARRHNRIVNRISNRFVVKRNFRFLHEATVE